MKEKIQKNTACLICHGKKNHYDFSVDKYRVEECANCGMMRLNPQPTDSELAAIYNEHYFLATNNKDEEKLHSATLKSSTANRYLDALEYYVNKPLTGSLLEVGCGHGDFLVQAAARGLSVFGVEYSADAVDIVSKKIGSQGNIVCGEIINLLESEQRFDYIVFADVLEHVRDPRQFLKHVHILLKDDGIIMTIVPSIDSFTARLMNNKWMEFKPEHLWYFSKSTLSQLLYSENFGEIKTHYAKKTLSFNYVYEHFMRYPVQPYSKILKIIENILPSSLKKHPIHVNASGIMMIAKKKNVKPIKTLSVIMAVYNEEKTISDTVENVLAKKIDNIAIELIIVESNSTDNTRTILQKYKKHERVKIIWQDEPRGKGYAIREGFKWINGDIVLIQDADDEYDFDDYDALIEPLLSGESAFVLGARHGGKAWKMRQFTNQRFIGHFLNFGHWFFALLVNVFFRLRLKDPFTMFKVFRADCLGGITFESDRFDFDFELLIKLVRNGYKPIEIPVNYRSRSFKEGKKVRVFRDPITWVWAIIKFRLQKI